MTSLAAATSTHGGSDESPEHEAARLVHEAETALHDAREPGADAWKPVAFMDWGRRQPFLFSAVLIIIALYVRLNVAETHISE